MGFRFRKSKKILGVRWTLSKSGLSASTGVKGLSVGVDSRGRVRRTVSIPGTGVSHTAYLTAESPTVNLASVKNEPPEAPRARGE